MKSKSGFLCSIMYDDVIRSQFVIVSSTREEAMALVYKALSKDPDRDKLKFTLSYILIFS